MASLSTVLKQVNVRESDFSDLIQYSDDTTLRNLRNELISHRKSLETTTSPLTKLLDERIAAMSVAFGLPPQDMSNSFL